MAVTFNTFWDDAGTVIPVGQALYAVNEQPIAEYDNYFHSTIVTAINDLIAEVVNAYNANTILKADTDNNPIALTIGEGRIIGRKTGSSIDALSDVDVRAMLNVADGADVTGSNAPQSHATSHQSGGGDAIKLDNLSTPDDNTDLNSSATKHGLCPKLSNNAAQYLNGVGGWVTPSGAGDMAKATYDPNADGVIAMAQLDAGIASQTWVSGNFNNYSHPGTIQCSANNYSHPSARACSSGSWAWGSISGKPGTYPPSAHNQSAATITSGTLPVARGGTGVTGDTYDADKVDGCDAGSTTGTVYKVPSGLSKGSVMYANIGAIVWLAESTDGYQLTTHGFGAAPTWAAASDLIFSDTHCPKCGLEFQDGDNLILHVIGHNEVGDILTIPMHKDCAEAPKKTVTIKRKVMEDQYILDELTGEPKVQRVQKMQEKTVTKHKMKEGYVLDNVTGKALKTTKDGKCGKTKYNLSDALETVEETVSEVVTEDVEFLL